MMELTLHILDIVENSARAGAEVVAIAVEEDRTENRLTIEILDNGKGMDEEMVRQVLDPFVTTKAEKKTGLGIPLLAEAARRTGGDLSILSRPGSGTHVQAVFELDHVDRQPLGDLSEMMVVLLASHGEVEFQLSYTQNGEEMEWDSSRIFDRFGPVLRTHPGVMDFVREDLAAVKARQIP